jgi:hypothetical protein
VAGAEAGPVDATASSGGWPGAFMSRSTRVSCSMVVRPFRPRWVVG